jgi:23S rRNA (cytidine1920-2'-O)/16S rRNA (cytidine1409-2'-O)-methyltransferase
VRRGLAPSRHQAQADIAAGRVTVGGAPADKAARLVAPDEPIRVLGPGPRFVGRGGEKLDAALTRFAVEVDGRRAHDLGASTGGFTDCLLQRGAASVVAVDVGYGQLAWSLRSDGRVEVHDRTNVRELTPDVVGRPVEVVVADLSFISLRLVLAPLLAVSTPDVDLVLMVKPQFEVGRDRVGKGGVVREPGLRADAVRSVADAAAGLGLGVAGVTASPLPGPSGNVEYFLWLRADAPPVDPAAVHRAVSEGPQ